VSGDIASGQIESAAEGDGRMCEVTADAVAPLDDFGSGQIGPAGGEAVLNIIVHPIADGLDAREAVGEMPELIPRKIINLSESQ